MKKLLFLMSMMLVLTLTSFGQKITYRVDDMTDKYSYTFHTSTDSTACFVSENDKTGFVLIPWFKEDLGRKLVTSLTFNQLYVHFSVNGMGCVENGSLIIKFTDGNKMNLFSTNDFNCKDYFIFSVLPKDRLILSSIPIDKIMLVDSSTGVSYTFSPDNSKFFIELNQAIGMPYIKSNQ